MKKIFQMLRKNIAYAGGDREVHLQWKNMMGIRSKEIMPKEFWIKQIEKEGWNPGMFAIQLIRENGVEPFRMKFWVD